MNTVPINQRNIYIKRPEKNCETVKIIKELSKINILFKTSIFQIKYRVK